MKKLIILTLHGMAGAGSTKKRSPYYPWPEIPSNNFLSEHVVCHKIDEQKDLLQGLFWKGAVDVAQKIINTEQYHEVKVVCGNGRFKSGNQFRKLLRLLNSYCKDKNDEVSFVLVGKSLGGFECIHIVRELLLRKRFNRNKRHNPWFPAQVSFPLALMVDPDDFIIRNTSPANIIPKEIKKVVVVRQENLNYSEDENGESLSFVPRLLRGRPLRRRNGAIDGIIDFVYPTPTLFPHDESEELFVNREVNHWTIDEHIVKYGHPQAGTMNDILSSWYRDETGIEI